jgi:hypothetical protein
LRRGWRSARRSGRRCVLICYMYTRMQEFQVSLRAFGKIPTDGEHRRRTRHRPPRWEISLRRHGFLFVDDDEQGRQGQGQGESQGRGTSDLRFWMTNEGGAKLTSAAAFSSSVISFFLPLPFRSGPTRPPRWEISLRRHGFLFVDDDEQGRQGQGGVSILLRTFGSG